MESLLSVFGTITGVLGAEVGAFGTTFGVFVGVTLILIGFCAYMTGAALANTWRPAWQSVPYAVLLGFSDRFLIFALFEGELLSLSGYVIDTLLLLGITLVSYRLTQVNKMITQYPWLYERSGPFSFRERPHDNAIV